MGVRIERYVHVEKTPEEPIAMARTTNNEQPKTPIGSAPEGVFGASRRKLLPFVWPLFTAMWLLFTVGFVVQVLRTDLSALQLLAFLVSMVAFAAVFLWLMLKYPFPVGGLSRRELWVRVALLAVLAVLALGIEFVYGDGVPYRFMYVVVAAAVILPTRQAAWTVLAVVVVVGVIFTARSGWDTNPTSWGFLVPFPLIGVGMIAVSRLVLTVRELQAAREEILRLAVSEERLRFARDLHDLLGRSLSSITLKSELAGKLLPFSPEKAASEVRDIEDLARRALREVREAVAGYRQPTLAGELEGACEMLDAAGIALRVEDESGVLSSRTDAVLAWTVREGVTNVIRHSCARHCEILLTRADDEIHATISDDGIGRALEQDTTAGTGLSGLEERIASFADGGSVKAGPLPGNGFRLSVNLPLENGTSSVSNGGERQ